MANYKLISYKNILPKISPSVYLAEGVVVAGDVTIQENSNIWFNSVIRGDVSPIYIGKNTNIQDGTVVHTARNNGPTYIGDNITVGHMVLLHACTIKDNAFIGMQSVIMDNAIVEEYGFVGAGSLIPAGKIVKKYELWMGRPAKFIRMINDHELRFMKENIKNYLDLAQEYKES